MNYRIMVGRPLDFQSGNFWHTVLVVRIGPLITSTAKLSSKKFEPILEKGPSFRFAKTTDLDKKPENLQDFVLVN